MIWFPSLAFGTFFTVFSYSYCKSELITMPFLQATVAGFCLTLFVYQLVSFSFTRICLVTSTLMTKSGPYVSVSYKTGAVDPERWTVHLRSKYHQVKFKIRSFGTRWMRLQQSFFVSFRWIINLLTFVLKFVFRMNFFSVVSYKL